MKDKFYQYIQNLQDTITSKLEDVDGKATFKEDIWNRPEGGGGRTRIIQNGNVFEKGLKLETKHWHAKPFDYLRYH